MECNGFAHATAAQDAEGFARKDLKGYRALIEKLGLRK